MMQDTIYVTNPDTASQMLDLLRGVWKFLEPFASLFLAGVVAWYLRKLNAGQDKATAVAETAATNAQVAAFDAATAVASSRAQVKKLDLIDTLTKVSAADAATVATAVAEGNKAQEMKLDNIESIAKGAVSDAATVAVTVAESNKAQAMKLDHIESLVNSPMSQMQDFNDKLIAQLTKLGVTPEARAPQIPDEMKKSE